MNERIRRSRIDMKLSLYMKKKKRAVPPVAWNPVNSHTHSCRGRQR